MFCESFVLVNRRFQIQVHTHIMYMPCFPSGEGEVPIIPQAIFHIVSK